MSSRTATCCTSASTPEPLIRPCGKFKTARRAASVGSCRTPAKKGASVSGAKLNIWDEAWGLNADICPCDLHFIDWIDRQKLTDAVIFHFGTGAHHVVGIENARPDRRNAVLGITASSGELDDYTR